MNATKFTAQGTNYVELAGNCVISGKPYSVPKSWAEIFEN